LALIHACTIEDGAMIDMQAAVVHGAIIKAGELVVEGSLVPPGKRVLKSQMWVGTPAKYIRDVRQLGHGMIDYILLAYMDLAGEHVNLCLDVSKTK
jgi:gamma-carbonic anhydrase